MQGKKFKKIEVSIGFKNNYIFKKHYPDLYRNIIRIFTPNYFAFDKSEDAVEDFYNLIKTQLTKKNVSADDGILLKINLKGHGLDNYDFISNGKTEASLQDITTNLVSETINQLRQEYPNLRLNFSLKSCEGVKEKASKNPYNISELASQESNLNSIYKTLIEALPKESIAKMTGYHGNNVCLLNWVNKVSFVNNERKLNEESFDCITNGQDLLNFVYGIKPEAEKPAINKMHNQITR